MSVRAIADVMEYSKTRNKEYAVLLAIANYYNDDEGCAWPGIERLARAGRCSIRGAWEAIKKLETMGEITVLRSGGGNPDDTNKYIINFKKFVPSSAHKSTGEESAPHKKPSQKRGAGYSPQGVQDRGRTSAKRGAESRPKSAPNTLRTLSDPLREEKDAGASPSPPDDPPDENPITKVQNRLCEVFPRAAVHMTGAEMHELHSCLAVLDELTAEDWQAMRLYFNDATDWVRTVDSHAKRPVKLWPRNRGHFLKEAGETVEKVREWWDLKGKKWYGKQQSKPKNKPPKAPNTLDQSQPTTDLDDDIKQYCQATGCKLSSTEIRENQDEYEQFMKWLMATIPGE